MSDAPSYDGRQPLSDVIPARMISSTKSRLLAITALKQRQCGVVVNEHLEACVHNNKKTYHELRSCFLTRKLSRIPASFGSNTSPIKANKKNE